jgi:phage gpG-like protein
MNIELEKTNGLYLEAVTAVNKYLNRWLMPIAAAIQNGIEQVQRERSFPAGTLTFGAKGQSPWAALSEKTKRVYKKKGWVLEPTLDRTTGGLQASILCSPSGNNAIEMTARKKYAAVQQFGKTYERVASERSAKFRQKKSGAVKFAKGKAKSNVMKNVKRGSYTVVMKSRPYIVVPPYTIKNIARILEGGEL